MRIALTGGTGFLGHYIANHLLEEGHSLHCWFRPGSDRDGFVREGRDIRWMPGALTDSGSIASLVEGVDAVVHAALSRQGAGFSGSEGDLAAFAQANIIGSLQLMQAAMSAGVERFIFISTCAVHDVILDDRPLDEAHPLWPMSHYGAHKAAIEKFVHSFAMREQRPWASLRPTGIYGLARPIEHSKWYGLIRSLLAGDRPTLAQGGKEVHAADVARSVGILLAAEPRLLAGQSFNCYDQYIADQDVAAIACELAGIAPAFTAVNRGPKNQIDTGRIRQLGMTFGGRPLLEQTVEQMVRHLRDSGQGGNP